jgi:hypothetical protein
VRVLQKSPGNREELHGHLGGCANHFEELPILSFTCLSAPLWAGALGFRHRKLAGSGLKPQALQAQAAQTTSVVMRQWLGPKPG